MKNQKAQKTLSPLHNIDGLGTWDKDGDRLLLYADIMGFSHRVNYNNHEDLKKSLLTFKHTWETKLKPLEKGDHLKSVQFSDSILIVVNGTTDKMFNLLTKAAVCLVQTAISLGFPIKGVIAQGKFSYDKENELFFGLPLVEAYQLHEQICYYGVVVHHSAEFTVKKYLDATKPYSKSKTALRCGKTSHYHLSWHLLNRNLSVGNITDTALRWLGQSQQASAKLMEMFEELTFWR